MAKLSDNSSAQCPKKSLDAGFNVPSPHNRQSSDSGFSNRTDLSNQTKPLSSSEEKFTPLLKRSTRKRSRESDDSNSVSSRFRDTPKYKENPRSRVNELKSTEKRRRLESDNTSTKESDYEDNSISQYTTDSDEPLLHKCETCGKQFESKHSLGQHKRVHSRVKKTNESNNSSLGENAVVNIPANNTEDDKEEEKLSCPKCGKMFKLKIMFNRHLQVCDSSSLENSASQQKELKVSLQNLNPEKKIECSMCGGNFKAIENLEKHMKMVHSAVLKDSERPQTVDKESGKRSIVSTFSCLVCNSRYSSKKAYFKHLNDFHFSIKKEGKARASGEKTDTESFQCRLCSKNLSTQDQLITHLAAHMSNIDDGSAVSTAEDESRGSTQEDSISMHSEKSSGPSKCQYCDKVFTYGKSLTNHILMKHSQVEVELKNEPPDTSTVVAKNEEEPQESEESTEDEDDNTCDICEKHFSYKRLLIQHKKTKHNISSGTKRANFTLKDCSVKCLICDITMKVSEINVHNQQHLSNNMKPRNLYTCFECEDTFKSCQGLQNHIKLVHRLKRQVTKKFQVADLADFCEVVVTKTEPLDTFQSHNDFGEVPGQSTDGSKAVVDISGFTCPICSKKMRTLLSLKRHVSWHNNVGNNIQKTYECFICKEVYLTHMAVHYKKGDSVENTVVGDSFSKDNSNAGETHKCPHCDKICDSESSLKCHISWHKSKTSLYGSRYQCTFCGLIFTNKRRRELHLRTHYEDENGPFKCEICGKGYSDENYYRRHLKGHNFDHVSHKKRIAKLRENKVKCPICIRYYPDVIKLIRHLRRTHPESKMVKTDPDAPPEQVYPCKLCAKVFLSEKRLQHHGESHLRKHTWIKCKFCGKKSISLKAHNIHIKSHLTEKHVDNPLKCPKCDEKFVRGYALHYHLRDEHQINETWVAELDDEPLNGPLKELQCSICLKILASKGNFERHIDYHNSLRCNYCFEYFNAIRFLEGHLVFGCEKKKLIGETEVYPKKVKCHICYKAFHLQVKLDCHMRTQHGIKVSREAKEGIKQIVCDYCFRVFENEDALMTHKLYHRTVGYYGCIYCNRKFNTMTLYRKHKNHHFTQLNVDNPTKCEHCDETFVAFRDMIYHMRDVHGDKKEWIVLPKESIEEECNICHKKFYNLHRHLRYHEENRCKKCSEYFFSRTDYDNHLCTIDSDDNPESNEKDLRPTYDECRFCFKPVTKTNSKLKHDLIHKSSGSISCRFCALKFNTMDAFNIHAFSHRSRKYTNNPLKCRFCNEKFIRYGPLMKHMKNVHKSKEKMHYRSTILPERCVVCGDDFPNLHNHYRAHLQNQCQSCHKYFTSSKLYLAHDCNKPDVDPTKVFTCDENLLVHINSYVPKDETTEKYYGQSYDENVEDDLNQPLLGYDEDNENFDNKMPLSIQSPIISDVLSLYKEQEVPEDNNDDIVEIIDDSPNTLDNRYFPMITIDD
ncbi:Zinc finger protein 26 [Eumeta japonica]|uniref:Zinc finger protein 26 n=1 Tax=Eumeta variegata TaxID=151549 RepID=A0A4C1ZRB1_EUMVA|nr:Zinc finger protein 26 [Eumeta japonica]